MPRNPSTAKRSLKAVIPLVAAAVIGIASLNEHSRTPASDSDHPDFSKAISTGLPPVSTRQARRALAQLHIATPGAMSGYDRSKFPHWITQDRRCDTREKVLQRDGTHVQTDHDCYPSSGSWISAYDGKTINRPSNVQIDHVVPLGNAWRSGAAEWSQSRRRAFANDLQVPQLVAVSAKSNDRKSDQSPDQWMPSNGKFHCEYVKSYILVKAKYDLTITSTESQKLKNVLSHCSDG